MNISKRVQILVLVLVPAGLLGMEHGSWTEQDKTGNNILIEWHKFTDYQKLLELEKELIPVMIAAFSHQTLQTGVEDEKIAMATKWLQQQNAYEMSKCIQSQQAKCNISFVVTIKDVESTKILGYAVFYLGPKFTQDCVVQDCVTLDPLAIIPMAQGRGLSRKLVFSIFKLLPEARQIDLFVQRENTRAQAVFNRFGFVVDYEIRAGLKLKHIKKN
ncbi:MAG: GNAT family N-acetyltransferase [Candidatus Babeliales bacterium]|jgi:ribosomal protein S18 acetylase RimI-like enzyme